MQQLFWGDTKLFVSSHLLELRKEARP